MVTLSMTQVKKKRKRYSVHNYYKSCGNCGLWLYTDEDITFVSGSLGPTDSAYFHTTYEGCVEATDRLRSKVGLHREGHAVSYGN
jgi:hypothetical protein